MRTHVVADRRDGFLAAGRTANLSFRCTDSRHAGKASAHAPQLQVHAQRTLSGLSLAACSRNPAEAYFSALSATAQQKLIQVKADVKRHDFPEHIGI